LIKIVFFAKIFFQSLSIGKISKYFTIKNDDDLVKFYIILLLYLSCKEAMSSRDEYKKNLLTLRRCVLLVDFSSTTIRPAPGHAVGYRICNCSVRLQEGGHCVSVVPFFL